MWGRLAGANGRQSGRRPTEDDMKERRAPAPAISENRLVPAYIGCGSFHVVLSGGSTFVPQSISGFSLDFSTVCISCLLAFAVVRRRFIWFTLRAIHSYRIGLGSDGRGGIDDPGLDHVAVVPGLGARHPGG